MTEHIFFCFDTHLRSRSVAYREAIRLLSEPIAKHLRQASYAENPMPGSINVRFFNQHRIESKGGYVNPAADVFISHGCADKNYWRARKVRDFRAVFVMGPRWKRMILADGLVPEERIFEVGYTKLDPIFQGHVRKRYNARPVVLWAPTHSGGKFEPQSSHPACLKLIREIPGKYRASVSPHPVNASGFRATMQALADADVVIADSGSTIYEALALGKPVIHPDWLVKDSLHKMRPGTIEDEIYQEGIGYHARSMDHLIKLIDVALEQGMRDDAQELIDDIYPPDMRGKAGERAAKALQEIAAAYVPGEGEDIMKPVTFYCDRHPKLIFSVNGRTVQFRAGKLKVRSPMVIRALKASDLPVRWDEEDETKPEAEETAPVAEPEETAPEPEPDLGALTVAELRALADEAGLPRSLRRKDDLIEAIQKDLQEAM